MDFFQHQDKAKNRTFLLIVFYILGLLGLTAVMVAAILALFAFVGTEPEPDLILLCIGGVLALVIGGSLFKTAALSAGGGCAVAEALGGRQICSSTTNPGERQLYNIVEEMSLAAGVPIPALYIMDNEKSINAFAAGFSPNAAVIGVNRGTIDLLTRDELQGVIAHEYAHILNGDMRMNMRLIGILFGLQLLAIVGYFVLRSVRFLAVGRQNKGSAAIIMAMLAGGTILMIVGYIGVFFSAIIRAAISRQREYLADASAVQFTRNPDGIAGALKKIGSPNIGSNIANAHAAETSHLFFGDVCGLFSLGGLLATHPDLTTRIRRIDPNFDGRFPKLSEIKPVKHNVIKTNVIKSKTSHFKNLQPTTGSPTIGSKQSVIENIGGLDMANVLTAGVLLGALPKPITESASNPLTAQAVFFAMLLDQEDAIRNRQLNQIQSIGSAFLRSETLRLYPQVRAMPEHEKVPLAQHISASLREMTKAQYRQFSRILDLLIEADQTMDLFEYTIKAVLHRDLDIHFGQAKQFRVRHTALSSVRRPAAAVLSYLAYSGHTDPQDAQKAFAAASEELGLSEPMLRLSETTTRQFDQSLRTLSETCPALKKRIFAAFMTCVWHDGKITPKEAGLIRAIAAMLAVPIPMLA
ncbi:MAG: M48 family metalloprotease [Planctomycetaceae bacterium]|nr:M48 family metalloprotease [Planctomycetaceae bacterium]